MTEPPGPQKRMLLLTTPSSYRAEPFVAAAARLGVEVVQAINLPRELGERRRRKMTSRLRRR